MMNLYLWGMHPLISIMTRFNLGYKRLSRFLVVSMQISTIAIICSIAFSPDVYRLSDHLPTKVREYVSCEQTDLPYILIAGFLLSILTLPPPEFMIYCLKSKLILSKKPLNHN